MIGGRHPGPVAEFLLDGQGLGVPVLGLIQPPPVLRDHAKLVTGGPDLGTVAEFLPDSQGPGVPALGLIQPPPLLRDHAELVTQAAAVVARSPSSSPMARDRVYQSWASSSRPRSCATMPSRW